MMLPEEPQQDDADKSAVKAWAKNYPQNVGQNGPVRRTGAVLKHTTNMYINASIEYWGGTPDEPRGGKLTIVKMPPSSEPVWDFKNADATIKLEKTDYIRNLTGYLNGEFEKAGVGNSHWLHIEDEATAKILKDLLGGGELAASDVQKLSGALALDADIIGAILDQNEDQADLAVQIRERKRRSAVLDELEKLVYSADVREIEFQRLLENHPWIFGGEVVRSHELRSISPHDQIDIPIIRGDGSMVIVELKRATDAKIKTADHGYPVVGSEVHLAVQQAERYLYELDSAVHRLLSRERFDARRATALVVIGVMPELEGTEKDRFEESFRIYNTHLARVQVTTYDQLLGNARRMVEIKSLGPGAIGDEC